MTANKTVTAIFDATPGTGDGQFRNPDSVAVATDGSVYVGDTGNHRIQRFNAAGTFVSKWGTEGTGDGQFRYPKIAVATDGSIYVADSGNHRIQRFTSEGVFVSKWGTGSPVPLSPGGHDGEFNWPYGVAVASDGSVYVADKNNHRLQK